MIKPVKEDNIQKQIIQYSKRKKIMIFAPINENIWSGILRVILIGAIGKARGVQVAGRAIASIVNRNKSMGQRKGVSDLIVIIKDATLFIEVKTLVGKMSPEQNTFKEDVESRGHVYYVVRSLDDYIEIIERHKRHD